jgi:hypothetical protein
VHSWPHFFFSLRDNNNIGPCGDGWRPLETTTKAISSAFLPSSVLGKQTWGEESAFSGSCGKDLLRPHLVISSLTKTNSSIENDRSGFPRGLQFLSEEKTQTIGADSFQT